MTPQRGGWGWQKWGISPGQGGSTDITFFSLFSSTYGWITVYSYGNKRSDWLAGTNDPQFAEEFLEVLAAAAKGAGSNRLVAATRNVTIGGQQFRAAVFSYDMGGRSFDSAAYLTAKDGQLLKYRISVKANSDPAVSQLAEQFIIRDQ